MSSFIQQQYQKFLNLVPVGTLPANPTPPAGLWPFLWHFLRQQKAVWAASMLFNGLNAFTVSIGPFFLGHIIDALTTHNTTALIHAVAGYVGLALLARLLTDAISELIDNQLLSASLPWLVNRQLHWFTLRHSLSYFQNDFAGRIASQLINTGGSIREILFNLSTSQLYFFVAATTGILTLASASPWLILPVVIWLLCYTIAWRILIPQLRQTSRTYAAGRSAITGQLVDVYTNIATVKLFAHNALEDHSATAAMLKVRAESAAATLARFGLQVTTTLLTTLLLSGTLAMALLLWSRGRITPGQVAMAMPVAIALSQQVGWFGKSLNNLFEALGNIDESIATFVKPFTVLDAPHATPLSVPHGQITFTNATFAYHQHAEENVLNHLNLTINANQKIGLVGPSGAGKSTLVNLLLRFYDLTSGTIAIDGHNIAAVTQDSLRENISMVTQDTSLLHRSIAENIRYGKPDATDAEVIRAAELAHADAFIQHLADNGGRTAYAARVGERGVKLSGGQRQRIAIARLILKNAPILILDEATSALDSEVEQAIQENLTTLMENKTVIAIAHRLSTLRLLDRILFLENGTIVEDGTHDALLTIKNGRYANLWARQSGGFLPE